MADSWPPVCLASREKEVDPFVQERRQLFSEILQFLTHQRSHKHRKQDEIHEHLGGRYAPLCAERSFR